MSFDSNHNLEKGPFVYKGRRRVFKSGPAEEVIECRRHERGERTRGGIFPPLVRGVWGASPEKFFEF